MPIKTVDTLDAVPEANRPNAIERKDGKFSYEEVDLTALNAEREDHGRTKEKLRVAKKDHSDAQAEVVRLQEAAAQGDGKLSAQALKEINDRHATEIGKANTERDTAKAQAKTARHRAALQMQAIDSGAVRDKQTLKEYLDVAQGFVGEDDQGNLVVLNEAKQPTGESLEKAMGKGGSLRRKWAFTGTGSSGGGAEGSDGDSAAPNNYDAAAAGKAAGEREKAARTASANAFT